MWSKINLTGAIITIMVFFGLCAFFANKINVSLPFSTNTSDITQTLISGNATINTEQTAWQAFLDSIDRFLHFGEYR